MVPSWVFWQEEKRRLKEEIEKRRAEAAEKRQKMPDEAQSDDKKPFKCFTPKGSAFKVILLPAADAISFCSTICERDFNCYLHGCTKINTLHCMCC